MWFRRMSPPLDQKRRPCGRFSGALAYPQLSLSKTTCSVAKVDPTRIARRFVLGQDHAESMRHHRKQCRRLACTEVTRTGRTFAAPQVQPESVLRWHRKGWRLYWTWKSRTKLGRPHLSAEVRELIARISKENPRWGTERIRGELLRLGIVVSNRSIRRYRWRRVRAGDSQLWGTFLVNQLHGIWAADLLVVQTVSFRILYVFFLIRHERRELLHFNVTANPIAAWIWQQLLEATPWGRRPAHLLHDRDAVYGGDFDRKLADLDIAGVRTPPRALTANAVAERLVRTIRTECLDHLIVIDQQHLRAVLAEFADYYNRDRPHRSLGLWSPLPRGIRTRGRVVSRPVLGGLHHVYARVA